MIYIGIPKGWVFEKKIINEVEKDVLTQIDDEGRERYIALQDIIKNCLRTKRTKDNLILINNKDTWNETISIHFNRLPKSDDLFLKYQPNHNGKYPATETSMVQGSKCQTALVSTGYRGLWFKNPDIQALLSPERLATLEEKSIQQRDDRRHIGDSPKAT